MKNGIVTLEIAKIAKEKSFNELVEWFRLDNENYNSNCYWEDFMSNEPANFNIFGSTSLPTYYQLINWVFDSKINSTGRLLCTLEEYNKWLKFWYNLLKDCPLKYEFKGRMLEYFRSNDQILVLNHWTKQPINGSIWENVYRPIINNIEYLTFFDTYEEAEHQGILEVFKLLKKN